MGEIYRAASVVGTHVLKTPLERRVSRAGELTGKNDEGKRGTSAVELPPPVADVGALAGNEQGTLVAEIERLRDLASIQERRIEQLDAQNEVLNADCELLTAEVERLHESLENNLAAEQAEGYEAGLMAAREEGDSIKAGLHAEFKQLRDFFEGRMASHLEEVDAFALELAFACIARIVGEHFESAEFKMAIIRQALSEVRGHSPASIRVSQHDLDLMRRYAPEFETESALIRYSADPRVAVGGCLIDTEAGLWDARLETQLQRLRDALASISHEQETL